MCSIDQRWQLNPGDYDAAGRARGEFREFLRPCASPDSDIDGAEMIFGELVTNALRHSTGDATVRVTCDLERLVIAIRDRGRGFDLDTVAGVERRDGEGGRGLMIAQRLGAAIRVFADSDACTVEARLPIRCRDA